LILVNLNDEPDDKPQFYKSRFKEFFDLIDGWIIF